MRNPFMPLVLLGSLLCGCSGRSTDPVATKAAEQPQAQASPALPKPSILPAETQALKVIDQVIQQDLIINPSNLDQSAVSQFRFSTEEALEKVETAIMLAATQLNQVKDLAEREASCRFVTKIFWNRIAVANSSSHRDFAMISLRPWLEHLVKGTATVLASHARVAQTLDPQWVLSSDPESAITDLTRRLPEGCKSSENQLPSESESVIHPLLTRTLEDLAVRKFQILTANGTLVNRLKTLSTLPSQSRNVSMKVLQTHAFERSRSASSALHFSPMTQTDPGMPQMEWTFHAVEDLGRCFHTDQTIGGSALHGPEMGRSCSLNGGISGVVQIMANSLTTATCGGNPCFLANIFSYALGGHRDRHYFERSEDEASNINYTADGTVTIPVCNNPSVCNPMVMLTYQRNIRNKEGTLIADAGTSDFVEISSRKLRNLRLTPNTPFLLDRSESPVNVQFHVSRDYTHIGVSGEAPALNHEVSLRVEDQSWARRSGGVQKRRVFTDSPPPQIERMMNAMAVSSASSIISQSGPVSDAAAASIAWYLSKDLDNVNSSPYHQFEGTYLRIAAIREIMESGEITLSFLGRKEMELANASVLSHARHQSISVVSFLLEDRNRLLRLLPIAAIADQIARLMELEDLNGSDLDATLATLEPLVNQLQEQRKDSELDDLQKSLKAIGTKEKTLLRTLSALTAVLEELETLASSFKTEICLYEKEISDLAPSQGAQWTLK